MITEKKEKLILKMSFFSGLLFAISEFIFAIYSHSQSSLTDAVYDTAELVFIALLLFLTPLFHKPISEKRPFGYFQIETIFIIIKGIMMLSVTLGVSAEVLHSVISGGNTVDNGLVSIFQCFLGIASIIIFIAMKRLSNNLSSPTIKAELLGWKLDITYNVTIHCSDYGIHVQFCVDTVCWSGTHKCSSYGCLCKYKGIGICIGWCIHTRFYITVFSSWIVYNYTFRVFQKSYECCEIHRKNRWGFNGFDGISHVYRKDE